MALSQKGVIVKIMPTEKVNDKFQKRSFWLRTEDQYPQTIEFQLTQVRCDLLDAYTEGVQILVHFDLQGRTWESPQKDIRVFNTLNCWKLERINATEAQSVQSIQPTTQKTVATVFDQFPAVPLDITNNNEGGNDLPF